VRCEVFVYELETLSLGFRYSMVLLAGSRLSALSTALDCSG
jgi:hypothetical protein